MLSGIFRLIKALLFASTFPASWFIQASIIAVTVVFFASKKIKNRYLLVISILIYCFAVLKSSYWSTVKDITIIHEMYKGYTFIFSSPVFNASSAFVWIVIGKLFAEKKIQINRALIFAYAQSHKLDIDALETEFDDLSQYPKRNYHTCINRETYRRF